MVPLHKLWGFCFSLLSFNLSGILKVYQKNSSVLTFMSSFISKEEVCIYNSAFAF